MENRKNYSILYPEFEGVGYKKLSETACHDLAIDMLCQKLTDNPREAKMIMDTVSNMTADKRVAEYRQKVFCDVLKSPNLRKRMIELFDKFEYIRNFGVLRLNTDEKTGMWHLFRRMDELSDYITCIESLQNCLLEEKVQSDGLRGLRTYIDGLYKDACFGEMKKDIEALKIHTSEIKSVTVGINVNERFEATSLGLISINSKYFKKSGVVSNLADALALKEKIKDTTDWDGNMHYHPVEKVKESEGFLAEITKERQKIMMSASKIEMGETTAKVPGGDATANSTFHLSDIASKMLDSLIKKVRDTLDRYADIAVVNISRLIPEFVYYIRFAEFVEKYTQKGYTFCEANVTEDESKLMKAENFYNLRLALSGIKKEEIVTNNLDFDKEHMVYVLTGANRGGKTTVTQAMGIMYVLAQGGIFVPATHFSYKPVDCIYTHFPADEDKTLDLGRLGEECKRFKKDYSACTKDSLYLLNESFSTTSFEEGYYIAKDSVKALLKKSVRTIYNTHIHKLGEAVEELNRQNFEARASSLVVQSEGGKRSFKIEIAPPGGKSYAMDIAQKYGVTYEMLTDGLN